MCIRDRFPTQRVKSRALPGQAAGQAAGQADRSASGYPTPERRSVRRGDLGTRGSIVPPWHPVPRVREAGVTANQPGLAGPGALAGSGPASVPTQPAWPAPVADCPVAAVVRLPGSKSVTNRASVSYTHLRAHETPEQLV